MMQGQQQLRPQLAAQRQPTAAAHQPFSLSQRSRVHRQLQQHRQSRGSFTALPARFADAGHVAYYEPPTAGSHKAKVGKRIKAQRKRLKELSKEASELGGQPSPTQWSQLVQELQEMSGSLSDVAKMAASSPSSSSSSSESEASDGGMATLHQGGRSRPPLPALGRLAAAGPSAAQAGSPASAEPELAAVLRLRDSPDTQAPAGAALLREAASSTASGRDTLSSSSSNNGRPTDAIEEAPRGNIVAAPAPATARVSVCQGKSCAKRGAAELLRQASAAGAGRPGVQVSGCKCLGKCKQGPAVRVRSASGGRPTVLTQAAKDGGAGLAALMETEIRQRAQRVEAERQLATATQPSDSSEQLASR